MQSESYQNVPVLVIFFTRPDCLHKLLVQLANSGLKKVFFASDGPRLNSKSDISKIEECRALVKKFSSQFQSVHFYYSQENLGCDTFVPKAISWFFSTEDQGIILEDDCTVDDGFLRFADFALKKYSNFPDVMSISAANFQNHKVGDGDYFFSRYPYIWGWATWARAWQYFENDATVYKKYFISFNSLNKIFKNRKQTKYWQKMMFHLAMGKINFWDAKWYFSIWMKNGFSITPNINLVENIGFGADATHTKNESENPGMNIGTFPLKIKIPTDAKPNPQADHELFIKRFSPTFAGYWRVFKSKFFKLLVFQ